jgi:transposase
MNHRQKVIQALISDKIDVKIASQSLDRSERQVYRLLAKARKLGVNALVHGNVGKTPANKGDQELWDEVMALIKRQYRGIAYRDLQVILKMDHNITVGLETLRKHLRAAGVAPKRTRARRRHETAAS